MYPQSREYKDLSRKEQGQADRIIAFCYDLLDMWDATLTAQLEPMNIRFVGGSFNDLDHFLCAEWVIDWQEPQGKRGGLSLTIYPREMEKRGYKAHMYMQIVNTYANMMWDKHHNVE